MPDSSTTWTIAGLTAPAEIAIDRWGIPHLTAASRDDLFLVQGFNAARDRLWQIDLWRKRGLGLLAADFGPGFLAQDQAARLLLYRGDMQIEWTSFGQPQARAIVEAFVRGVNAYVALTEADPALLPAEFRALGSRPARWQADDVLRIRSHAWIRNIASEVARSQVGAAAGLEADTARRAVHGGWAVHVPDGIVTAVPGAVLKTFRLATEPPVFSEARLAAGLGEAPDWVVVPGQAKAEPDPLSASNNWAIGGARTATGRPILANDPHRDHALPCLRYAVHMTCPDLDLAGAGEPAVPGISIGHNGHVAFGLTVIPADQEDLFVYELHPDDPTLYRYGEGWEKLRIAHDTVAVKGHPDQQAPLAFTRHGPVLHIDPAARRAYALCSVWLRPGAAAYLNSLAFLDSRTVHDQAKALRHWAVPAANQVHADVQGNVAWLPSGMIPRRRNWDGLLPVPGDGRYEWDGFLAPEELPRLVNPPEGYVATANEMNMPPDFPLEERRISFEWAEPSRAERIRAVLDAQDRHSVAQSMALQCDVVSIPARRAVALLRTGLPGAPAGALALLLGWDHALTAESPAAALFELWWSKHLKAALLGRVGDAAGITALLAPGDNDTLLGWLEGSAPIVGDRDALLAQTLAAAWDAAAALMGPDPAGWAWGRLHHGYFSHPLAKLPAGSATGCRDIGPLPTGGSESTPMACAYRNSDFRVMKGASLRLVMDVGDWDGSRIINGPGQSGDPASPHYDDHAAAWAKGDYVPFLYTRAAIEPELRRRIRLLPRDGAA